MKKIPILIGPTAVESPKARTKRSTAIKSTYETSSETKTTPGTKSWLFPKRAHPHVMGPDENACSGRGGEAEHETLYRVALACSTLSPAKASQCWHW